MSRPHLLKVALSSFILSAALSGVSAVPTNPLEARDFNGGLTGCNHGIGSCQIQPQAPACAEAACLSTPPPVQYALPAQQVDVVAPMQPVQYIQEAATPVQIALPAQEVQVVAPVQQVQYVQEAPAPVHIALPAQPVQYVQEAAAPAQIALPAQEVQIAAPVQPVQYIQEAAAPIHIVLPPQEIQLAAPVQHVECVQEAQPEISGHTIGCSFGPGAGPNIDINNSNEVLIHHKAPPAAVPPAIEQPEPEPEIPTETPEVVSPQPETVVSTTIMTETVAVTETAPPLIVTETAAPVVVTVTAEGVPAQTEIVTIPAHHEAVEISPCIGLQPCLPQALVVPVCVGGIACPADLSLDVVHEGILDHELSLAPTAAIGGEEAPAVDVTVTNYMTVTAAAMPEATLTEAISGEESV